MPYLRSKFLPYGVAILTIFLALLLTLMLDRWIGMAHTPFLLFFGAITVSAWAGGFKPGGLATLLSALLCQYFFFQPTYTLSFGLADNIRLGLFTLEGLLVSALCEALHRAKRRAEVNARRFQISEERFHLALSNSTISIFQQDEALRYQWIYTPKGPTPAELVLGKSDFELFSPSEAEQLTTIKQQALASGSCRKAEVCVTVQGKANHYDLTVQPLQGSQQGIRQGYEKQMGIICVAVNITERKQAEIERSQLLAREQTARAQAEAIQQRFAFLDTAGTVLASSLDYQTTLQSVVDLVVPEFADLCSIDVLHDDASINPLVAVQARTQTVVDQVRQLSQAYPLDLNDTAQPIARVFQTGQSEFLPIVTDADRRAIAQDETHLQWLQNLGVTSAICVPLSGRDAVFGVLTLMLTHSEWSYRPDDLILAEELGHRVGMAIENSRLHRQLQQAIRRQEESLALLNAWLASSPIALAFLDPDLRYLYLNETLAVANGLPINDHLGRTLQQVLPQWAPRLEPALRQVIQTQEPLLNQELSDMVGSEGDRHSLVSYYPVCLADGQLLGVGVTVVDVTELKHTEQALRDSEAKFRSVVESNMIGIGFWDTRYAMPEVNDALVKILGYTREELAADDFSWRDLTPPEYRWLDEQAIAQLTVQGHCTPYEKELIRKDGFRLPVLVGWGHVANDLSRGTFFVLDISDRKRIEYERKRSEAKRQRAEQDVQDLNRELAQHVAELQTLLDVVPVGIAIADDPQCHVIRANPFFQKIFNIAPDANLSVTGTGEKVPVQRLRDGVELPIDELPMQMAVTRGEEVRNAEMEIVRPDGVRFNLLGSATPLFTEQGEVRGCVAVFMDITNYKQMQEKLKTREEQMRLVVEGAALGTWDYDLQSGELLWSDRCKAMFGLALETTISYEVFLNAVHPQDRDRVDQAVNQAVAEQCDYDIEMRTQWNDGTVHWVRSLGRAYYDRTGTPYRMAGLTLDITERKQAQAELERLLQREQAARTEAERVNRIKDEFLAVLSHELRSPLNPILGWAKLLRSRPFNETARDRALEVIERNAKLQAQLIEDLLDVSRILRGKLSLNVMPVNLVEPIQGAIETVRLAAEAKSIQIHFASPPSSEQNGKSTSFGRVAGDASRLQQIAWNLLSNAVKFTPSGGQVEIQLAYVDDQAQIRVSDTGKGIDPSFLPYVFDHFRQADSTTTRNFGGLGLGLAIVRHLVELHGGIVSAESAGEGKGATFIVMLPLLKQEHDRDGNVRDPAISLLPDSASQLQDVRVLAVDDEADMRDYITFVLEQTGADVTVANSAQAAIALLSQDQPDIIISDIGMPHLDGYMLLKQIRSLSSAQGGSVPAIALTAYAAEYDQQKALAAGFQLHLPKPVEPDQLIKAILGLLGKEKIKGNR
jgi:PAS domain S-box-containing protein